MFSFPRYYVYSYLSYLYDHHKNYNVHEHYVLNLSEFNEKLLTSYQLKTEAELNDLLQYCITYGYLGTLPQVSHVRFTLKGRLFVEEPDFCETIKKVTPSDDFTPI